MTWDLGLGTWNLGVMRLGTWDLGALRRSTAP